jgi:hypothetical protein
VWALPVRGLQVQVVPASASGPATSTLGAGPHSYAHTICARRIASSPVKTAEQASRFTEPAVVLTARIAVLDDR